MQENWGELQLQVGPERNPLPVPISKGSMRSDGTYLITSESLGNGLDQERENPLPARSLPV